MSSEQSTAQQIPQLPLWQQNSDHSSAASLCVNCWYCVLCHLAANSISGYSNARAAVLCLSDLNNTIIGSSTVAVETLKLVIVMTSCSTSVNPTECLRVLVVVQLLKLAVASHPTTAQKPSAAAKQCAPPDVRTPPLLHPWSTPAATAPLLLSHCCSMLLPPHSTAAAACCSRCSCSCRRGVSLSLSLSPQ